MQISDLKSFYNAKFFFKFLCKSCLYLIYSRKYERSKQMTINLQRTEAMQTEQKKQLDETLKQQEIRYEKMKNHAMGQLEM